MFCHHADTTKHTRPASLTTTGGGCCCFEIACCVLCCVVTNLLPLPLLSHSCPPHGRFLGRFEAPPPQVTDAPCCAIASCTGVPTKSERNGTTRGSILPFECQSAVLLTTMGRIALRRAPSACWATWGCPLKPPPEGEGTGGSMILEAACCRCVRSRFLLEFESVNFKTNLGFAVLLGAFPAR